MRIAAGDCSSNDRGKTASGQYFCSYIVPELRATDWRKTV